METSTGLGIFVFFYSSVIFLFFGSARRACNQETRDRMLIDVSSKKIDRMRRLDLGKEGDEIGNKNGRKEQRKSKCLGSKI